MKTFFKTIAVETKQENDFVDITGKIEAAAKESNIQNGLINIFVPHTTAALVVNENDASLLEDFKKNLENTAPKNLSYRHNQSGEGNAHSHCRAMHLLPGITLSLAGGEIQLGQWQRILFAELDRGRQRRIEVQIIGE